MSPSPARRRLFAAAAAVTAAVTLASFGPAVTAANAVTAPPPGATNWGVYNGPGERTATGAAGFAEWSGLPISRVMEFPPHEEWSGHTGFTDPGWILSAYADTSYRLEYSLPMLPDDPDTNLEACAAGDYNAYWTRTGKALVANGKANAFIRTGWEMNGNWYRWSATGRTQEYIGCFQQIVTTMRDVPKERFAFTWNPNAGWAPFAGELAYPGDAYVDVVGVDVYDQSWQWYPVPAGLTDTEARQKAWNWLERGDHGLNFWRDFAKSHKKRLAIPEWALSHRDDGHGGGDDPLFMNNMLDFIADPFNSVTYTNYFNMDGPTVRHDLRGGRFPNAAAVLQARSQEFN